MVMEFPSQNQLLEETSRRWREIGGTAAGEIHHVVAPYRICLLGAHVDHQGGPVLGRTIGACTVFAYRPVHERMVRIRSINYPGEVHFSLAAQGLKPAGHWGDYIHGAADVLQRQVRLDRGLVGIVNGALPGSGLSSSASVGLAYLAALAAANEIALDEGQLIELDRRLENDFLGLQNGIMDQSIIVHGRRQALLHVDTREEVATQVPDPSLLGRFRFLIVFSGLSRDLVATGFNRRVEECFQATRQLARLGRIARAGRLSDVPADIYEAHRGRLPAHLRRRADHFFGEGRRVEAGRIAWRDGDLAAFGALMNDSCNSSIHNYESGIKPIQQLQAIVSAAPGVLGSRFSGGGYGGCVVGLVEENSLPEAIPFIEKRYSAAYPQLAGEAHCYVAQLAGGLRQA